MSARTMTRTLILSAALAGLLLLGGCSRERTDTPDLGLKPGASQGGVLSTDSTGGASAQTTDSKSPAGSVAGQGSPTSGPGAATQGGATSGSGDGGAGGSSGPGSASQSNTAAKLIRIKWWNDTQAVPPKNPVIEFGGKRVTLKAGKSDTLAIGPCPVGEDLTFAIYPDGTAGKRIVATFRVEARMIADSEQDAIHVEVRDDRVRVLGNPIPNFERTFER